MKKTIYSGLTFVIIVSLLTLLFTSCNGETYTFKRVIIMGTYDGGIFDSSTRIIDIIGDEYQDENKDKIKSIELLNGSCENIRYVKSIKSDIDDYAIYSSENGNISYRYDSKSNLLTQIHTTNNAIPIPTNITTESGYQRWVKKLLAAYDVNSLLGYKYSCETDVATSNENSHYKDQYPYFYTDLEFNEKIISYTFTYTKHLDGYPTTDRILVYINVPLESVIIKFDKRDFINIHRATVDDSTITTTINSYMINSVNTERYELTSMQIMHKTLTYFENEVCMEIDVEMDFLDKKTQYTICDRTLLLLCP